MPIDVAKVTTQVDGLVAEYEALRQQSKYDDLSDLKDQLAPLDVRLSACIDRLAPAGSSYAKEAARHGSLRAHARVPKLVGVLRALRADVEAGWLDDLAALLHADTFADQLEQADVLLASGYKDAAAVVAGVALETHLRLLAGNVGLSASTSNGPRKKADVVNADLAKAGSYTTVQQKGVTAWLGIRNASAHGESSKFSEAEVRQMIAGVADFIGRYPA